MNQVLSESLEICKLFTKVVIRYNESERKFARVATEICQHCVLFHFFFRYRGYYMPAHEYKLYLRVFNSILS